VTEKTSSSLMMVACGAWKVGLKRTISKQLWKERVDWEKNLLIWQFICS